ncbi:DUF1501 domain-containing protein [Rubinisphaera margarita]|uniref:DUF1501 domain-containing protein n=1 Tax=Rubinisphaera margarita TaxID=2909586 RepID=UPI001EE94BFF|nr:DUF1501 domain-containing protein [Rubinisphaera margarita]MCG6156874.1 DUF1501 domain-containing protein [Rubinisphaera margarita]
MLSNRREFLQLAAAGAVTLGTQGLAPAFLRAAAREASGQSNILVVIQMSGGNDGLNTVVPFAEDRYYKARPKLAIGSSDVLKIDKELGLNPVLRGFADLLEAGHLGIVQGVGYPNPNRSHFESMDIWHTCHRRAEDRNEGWLGRAVDQLQGAERQEIPGVHVGNDRLPLALVSRSQRIPSIQSMDQFHLKAKEEESVQAFRRMASHSTAGEGSMLDFLTTSTVTALDVSRQIQESLKDSSTAVDYPQTGLGRKLRSISQLISADLGTRIFYAEIDGFDTHALQAGAHTGLLRELGEAVSAFVEDLKATGNLDRVTTVCFSEFGRRVAENASEGTDHGTAAPMFLIGGQVQSGLIGKHPSLDDLEQGDLKYHTDFRQVYAGLLQQWLKCDSDKVLGEHFDPVSVIRKS